MFYLIGFLYYIIIYFLVVNLLLRYCINEKDKGNKKRKEFLTFSVYIQINNCEKSHAKTKTEKKKREKIKTQQKEN